MPHRTPGWMWAGRVAALVVVAGLVVYFADAGLNRASEVAGPMVAVIALATFFAPYLLPVYQAPEERAKNSDPAGNTAGSPAANTVILADHGSIAAQTIGQININSSRSPTTPPGGDQNQ
jgi:hypothetical protein